MKRIVGIMGAMPEEISEIVDLLEYKEESTSGMRTYHKGYLNNIETIVVFSRWGKVAAAVTVSHLILKYKITELYFTGVAGAIDPDLQIGDIVIGQNLFQHDMDARPLMPQFEIPLLKTISFQSTPSQVERAFYSTNKFINSHHFTELIGEENIMKFGLKSPKVIIGDIASGDKFFATNDDKNNLRSILPNITCVEMEGASVAQVCYEYKIPFTIIRTISDSCDEKSHIDFPLFIQNISNKYSVGIIKSLFTEF